MHVPDNIFTNNTNKTTPTPTNSGRRSNTSPVAKGDDDSFETVLQRQQRRLNTRANVNNKGGDAEEAADVQATDSGEVEDAEEEGARQFSLFNTPRKSKDVKSPLQRLAESRPSQHAAPTRLQTSLTRNMSEAADDTEELAAHEEMPALPDGSGGSDATLEHEAHDTAGPRATVADAARPLSKEEIAAQVAVQQPDGKRAEAKPSGSQESVFTHTKLTRKTEHKDQTGATSDARPSSLRSTEERQAGNDDELLAALPQDAEGEASSSTPAPAVRPRFGAFTEAKPPPPHTTLTVSHESLSETPQAKLPEEVLQQSTYLAANTPHAAGGRAIRQQHAPDKAQVEQQSHLVQQGMGPVVVKKPLPTQAKESTEPSSTKRADDAKHPVDSSGFPLKGRQAVSAEAELPVGEREARTSDDDQLAFSTKAGRTLPDTPVVPTQTRVFTAARPLSPENDPLFEYAAPSHEAKQSGNPAAPRTLAAEADAAEARQIQSGAKDVPPTAAGNIVPPRQKVVVGTRAHTTAMQQIVEEQAPKQYTSIQDAAPQPQQPQVKDLRGIHTAKDVTRQGSAEEHVKSSTRVPRSIEEQTPLQHPRSIAPAAGLSKEPLEEENVDLDPRYIAALVSEQQPLPPTPLVAPTVTVTAPTPPPLAPKLQAIVDQVVEAMYTVTKSGQTDTVIVLQHPPLFAGVTVKISTYEQAPGQLNVSFSNLTSSGKRLLDENLASLKLNLEKNEHSFIVQQLTTTTLDEVPRYTSGDGQQQRDKEGGRQGGQQQQGGDARGSGQGTGSQQQQRQPQG